MDHHQDAVRWDDVWNVIDGSVKSQIASHERLQIGVRARPVRTGKNFRTRVGAVDHRHVKLVITDGDATIHGPIPNEARVRRYLDIRKRRAPPEVTRVKE